jgi:hypothetical protein
MSEAIQALALVDTKRAAIEARDAGGDTEAVLRAAMVAARDNCMAPKGDDLLIAACGGFLEAFPDMQGRVVAELQSLKALAALMSGVPVDMERFEAPEDPIGIGRVFREVAA